MRRSKALVNYNEFTSSGDVLQLDAADHHLVKPRCGIEILVTWNVVDTMDQVDCDTRGGDVLDHHIFPKEGGVLKKDK